MYPHSTTKVCRKCGEPRTLDQFSKSKQHADGLYPWCRACRAAYKRQPAQRAYQRAYKQRPEAQAQRREYDKRPDVKQRKQKHWEKYISDPDKHARVLAQQRERWANDPALRERKRNQLQERYHTNPEHKRKQFEYSNAAIHRRRAKLRSNGGSHTAKEWRALCEKYNHRCLCCGELKPLTKDHVMPLDKGGTDDITNLQPLCLECNLRKHAKHIDYRPVE